MYSNISWTEAPIKDESTNTTLPAWLGFSAGDGIRFTSISDTSLTSNVNHSGVWTFRVDGNNVIQGGELHCIAG